MKRVLLVATCILSGCAAKPAARLAFINSQTGNLQNQIDSYAFPRTYLDFKEAEGSEGFNITARNQTYESFRVAVAPANSLAVKTRLGLTKYENSDMLKEVGIETKDDRVSVIEGFGKLVLGVLPFVGMSASLSPTCSTIASGSSHHDDPDYKPQVVRSLKTLDSLQLMQDCRVGVSGFGNATEVTSWRKLGDMQVWFGPLPPDATSVQVGDPPAFRELHQKAYGSGIVYAACREARFSFYYLPKASGDKTKPTPVATRVIRSIYVADPRYFRYVAFPFKGSVKLHPQCGTSVVTDNSSQPASELAIAAAILEQGKAIKDAVDKAKKED